MTLYHKLTSSSNETTKKVLKKVKHRTTIVKSAIHHSFQMSFCHNPGGENEAIIEMVENP